MNERSIPGWTIDINEISNGVFKVTLTNAFQSTTALCAIAIAKAVVLTSRICSRSAVQPF